eukprot:1264220-Rhodomonas_salina.1
MNLAASRTPSNSGSLLGGEEEHGASKGRVRREHEEGLDSDVKDYFAKSRCDGAAGRRGSAWCRVRLPSCMLL